MIFFIEPLDVATVPDVANAHEGSRDAKVRENGEGQALDYLDVR